MPAHLRSLYSYYHSFYSIHSLTPGMSLDPHRSLYFAHAGRARARLFAWRIYRSLTLTYRWSGFSYTFLTLFMPFFFCIQPLPVHMPVSMPPDLFPVQLPRRKHRAVFDATRLKTKLTRTRRSKGRDDFCSVYGAFNTVGASATALDIFALSTFCSLRTLALLTRCGRTFPCEGLPDTLAILASPFGAARRGRYRWRTVLPGFLLILV